MTIQENIAMLLHENNVSVFDATGLEGNTFIDFMPETPDTCIVLTLYAGDPPLLKQLDTIERPSLQVRTRGLIPTDALLLCQKIERILDQFRGDIDGTFYLWIRAKQSPTSMGIDSNNRFEYVQNYSIERRITL